MQVRASGTKSSTTTNIAIERGKTFLLETVYICGEFVTSLLDCLKECAEQWILNWASLLYERSIVATIFVITGGC
jgi:hypothetical protein